MKVIKIAAVAALVAIGVAQGRADQTNVVEYLTIRLQGVKQGGTSTNKGIVTTSVDNVRITTAKVLNALSVATGRTYPAGSHLFVITPLDGGYASVEVRGGGSSWDVTPFFVLEQSGSPVTRSTVNTKKGSWSQTSFSIQRFALQGASLGLHFDISGIATDLDNDPANRPPGGRFRLDGAGYGDVNGVPAVLQGVIILSDKVLEVSESEDDPNPS